MKPKYPLVFIYARDWGIRTESHTMSEARKSFEIPKGWLVGWLIEDGKDVIKLAHEYFEELNGEDEFRYISIIPKETVIHKKIILQEIYNKIC